MPTVANLAKRLGMDPEEAVNTLRHMLFDVANADSVITDEECDLLIDALDSPEVADQIRAKKLKEKQKAEEAQKKAEAKRKAAEKKAAAAAKAAAKKKAVAPRKEPGEPKAAEAEETAAEIMAAAAVPGEEPGPAEAAVAPEGAPAKPVAPVPGRVVAEILPEERPKAPSIVIGSAIGRDARHVEVLRADGTRVEAPDIEILEVEGPPVEEEEEFGLLAEAQRRQEEEERRRAKAAARPVPQPDPAVVAEVIRRAKERGQHLKTEQKVVKQQKLLKQQRAEKLQRGVGVEEDLDRRAGSTSTGKTARKRQKRAEKARTEEAMRREAAQTLREYQTAGIPGAPKKRKRRPVHEGVAALGPEVEAEELEIIEVGDKITVEDLALAIEVPVNDVILDLMDLNLLANKNQVLSMDIVQEIGRRRGFDVRAVIPEEVELMVEEPDDPADLVPRAPVITVMGHVDHGKTTLLDTVRSAHVAEGEAGGITQHIAAYDFRIKGGRVVFLDTPGHEAFTQMRARGAKVTDVVVLVVAADDGVMPQTVEAIDHAKAAEVPIVVAINKCDKPDAQPDRIRQELTQYGLVDEQWGGKTIMRNISAKTRQGVDELMELLSLEADLLELKANPKKQARGVIVESEITRGMGPVAWVLVQNGTLRTGDVFLAGECYGRVRTLQDSHGENVAEAGPATPVVVTGFNAPPHAGTSFVIVPDERVARAIAAKRAEVTRQKQGPVVRHITLEDFHERLLAGEKQQLNVVLKADVQGSVDVLQTSLGKLGNEQVRVSFVHAGVGGVNESDVLLASASDAVIIGFHVMANAKVQKMAEQEGVDIRTYRVIYEALNEVRAALEGMLAPVMREAVTGHAEIRAVFRSSAVGNIAGCYVSDGEVFRGSNARLLRDNVIVHEGKIQTLRRVKDDVRSVPAGLECGIKIENFDDIKVGDVVEVYRLDTVAQVLA
jgi:translation initiation factor IF-2